MLIRPYAAADLDALILQPAQAHLQAQLLNRGYAQSLEASQAYTCLAQGRVIACVGLYRLHPQRALAWALIARDCGRHFVAIHKAALRYLRDCPITRVEAQVDGDFTAARRWMHLLGFTCETPQGMRAYAPDGRSCAQYAWIRPDWPGPAATSLDTPVDAPRVASLTRPLAAPLAAPDTTSDTASDTASLPPSLAALHATPHTAT